MSANTERINHPTYGLAGQVSRSGDSVIEPKMVADPAPESYGHAVSATEDGKITKVSALATVLVVGFIAGSYPRLDVNPIAGRTDNLVRRGYMIVPVGAGDPYPHAPVYVRIQNPTDEKPIGGVEATADGANTVLVNGAKFETVLDSNGAAEISFGFVNG